ncbi:metallopeptidase PepO, peptidase [Basidiobolus meristosporus CBS 931.73]|uniref:Metallopeptidase PepO, peptidase n=1 Tax=Basidiobolus meristosporus CBS 931.73 TaxID=1314790 RepID=A0A1Y1Y172_9FUNG|nr:metallopeptidase PepO, peptidase [Basidiobolus meristosporus CBS 931.73]|eukprot:ORX91762.1 metallopeptidase PepO, peptidase [Basidiobolus meristosporus CBS 931.73]
MRKPIHLLVLSLSVNVGYVYTQDLPPQVPAASEDFYFHVNYDWIKNTTLPPDQTQSNAFTIVQERNKEYLLTLLEKAGNSTTPSLLGDFYASGMNTTLIEQSGLDPIKALLNQVAIVRTPDDTAKAIGKLHSLFISVHGGSPLFSISAQPDSKNSTWTLARIVQSGLSLPNREYYSDAALAEIRQKYQEHVEKIFTLAQVKDGAAKAKVVLDFETALANNSLSSVEMRDVYRTYNKLTFEQLRALTPAFPWLTYCQSLGWPQGHCFGDGDVIVDNPNFLRHVNTLFSNFHADDWRTYLQWQVLGYSASYLGQQYEAQDFDFYGRTLRGQSEPSPRWKFILGVIGDHIPDTLSQPFVQEKFKPEAKAQAQELVTLIQDALATRLQTIEWMGPETRARALEKLKGLDVKIGYPDKWDNYTDVKISRGQPLLSNVLQVSGLNFKKGLQAYNSPSDKSMWLLSAFQVNAYYYGVQNSINFPAGILQPPFFYPPDENNPSGNVAANFGSIGSIIGHEITHGYDDQGRNYNAQGNLEDWWTPADAAEFEKRAKVLIDLYSTYEVYGVKVNGNLTQGENIGDIGGLKLSYLAFQEWQKKNPGVIGAVDGLSPEQQFFTAFGQLWKNVIRKELALLSLQIDPHSPTIWRVNGPCSNLQEFYEAFGVKEGDKMYRSEAERVNIW